MCLHGQSLIQWPIVFPCHGWTALGQQWLVPLQGPIQIISLLTLLHSGQWPHMSLWASGLGFSPRFIQESLPFLLCPQPRMPTVPYQLHRISRLTPKPGLSNLSSIVSSSSLTKKKSHYSYSQSNVHILYILNSMNSCIYSSLFMTFTPCVSFASSYLMSILQSKILECSVMVIVHSKMYK